MRHPCYDSLSATPLEETIKPECEGAAANGLACLVSSRAPAEEECQGSVGNTCRIKTAPRQHSISSLKQGKSYDSALPEPSSTLARTFPRSNADALYAAVNASVMPGVAAAPTAAAAGNIVPVAAVGSAAAGKLKVIGCCCCCRGAGAGCPPNSAAFDSKSALPPAAPG